MLLKDISLLITLSLTALPASGLRRDNYMYGYPCKSYSDCTSSSSYESLNELRCIAGRCNCTTDTAALVEVRYNSAESRYECDSQIFNMFGAGGGADCKKEECGPNSICVKGKKRWNPWIDDYRCVCNDGYIEVSNKCREVEQVSVGEVCSTPKTGPLKFCDINYNKSCIKGKCTCIRNFYNDPDIDACVSKEDYIEKYKVKLTVELFEACTTGSDWPPRICNEAENMTCISSKCQCHKKFYYDSDNTTSFTCKSKASFVSEYNLTEYRVMPGMYCHTELDCIEGLTCHNNNCSCPYPCEFIYRSSTCDCGAVSATEGAGQAMVVGIIGGIFILAGWCHLIKKQIRKAKGEDCIADPMEEEVINHTNSEMGSYLLHQSSNTGHNTGPMPSTSSSHDATTHSPPPAPALPQKHAPPDSATPFTPPPSYNSQAPPPYTPSTYQQPTAPPISSTTVPITYQNLSSYPNAPYPSAPNTGAPFSSMTSQPGTTSQPSAPYPDAPELSTSGVPSDPPPAYTLTPKPVDIYQPIN